MTTTSASLTPPPPAVAVATAPAPRTPLQRAADALIATIEAWAWGSNGGAADIDVIAAAALVRHARLLEQGQPTVQAIVDLTLLERQKAIAAKVGLRVEIDP